MDNRLADGTAVAGLANLADYIKKTPECPSGGTYTAGAIGADPACSEGGTHIL